MHWRRRLALNGLYRTLGFSMFLEVIEKMERETGLEPATSSLGRRQQIGNKEHYVSVHLVLAIENTQFSPCAPARFLTEHKRSTRKWSGWPYWWHY